MENNQQGSVKICENCFKPFPQQKIDLHQAYCRRNIKKCLICQQMYDVNDQQGHEKQFHSKKQCRYCHLTLPQKQMDVHQPSCKRRPIKCKYCQNDVAYEQVLKHQDACGARTVKCEICRRYVALRQMDTHKLGCQQLPESPRILEHQRVIQGDQLRQNVRDFPLGLQRMRSEQQRRPSHNQVNIRGAQDYGRRNDRNSNQRMNVVSNQRPKVPLNKKPVVNFQMNIKPSHIIGPQKVRQFVDIVPLSIRLAMEKNKKMPLQNRNN